MSTPEKNITGKKMICEMVMTVRSDRDTAGINMKIAAELRKTRTKPVRKERKSPAKVAS